MRGEEKQGKGMEMRREKKEKGGREHGEGSRDALIGFPGLLSTCPSWGLC